MARIRIALRRFVDRLIAKDVKRAGGDELFVIALIAQPAQFVVTVESTTHYRLVDSKKFGDTLVGRAQKIKELGAKTSKSLPKELLDFEEENGNGVY